MPKNRRDRSSGSSKTNIDPWLKEYSDQIAKREKRNMKPRSDASGGEWERPQPGTHPAYCFAIIDMGEQPSTNPKFGDAYKVRLEFELASEPMTSGKPFIVSREFVNFINPNRASKFKECLEAWTGEKFTAEFLDAFDYASLLGQACFLTLVENEAANGKTYTNIQSVTALPTGMEMPAIQTNESFIFDFETRDPAAWRRIPDFLKKRIEKANNWRQSAVPKVDEFEDDIPF